MKKKITSMLMALVMVLSMVTSASAANAQQQNTADALNYLQLFLGTGNNADGTPIYALDSNLTREQGVMLLLRMLGKLDEAEKCTAAHPFKDVTVKYYDKYLAYAYTTKLTAGVSATTFGFGESMTERMFLTFCLRALGYTDGEQANYVWNNAYALAKENKLVNSTQPKTVLLRADAIEVFWNALSANVVGSGKTLAKKLIDEGVFTEQAYTEACNIEQNGKETAVPEVPSGGGGGGAGAGTGGTPTSGGETKPLTWVEYQALSGPEKDAYFASFADPMDFVKWMQEAQSKYNEENPAIEIKPGEVIDLGKLK